MAQCVYAVLIAVMDAPARNVGIYTRPVTTPMFTRESKCSLQPNRLLHYITRNRRRRPPRPLFKVLLLLYLFIYTRNVLACYNGKKKTMPVRNHQRLTWCRGRTYEAGQSKDERRTSCCRIESSFSYFLVVDFRVSEVRKCKQLKI
jgi:hypothetical protein